MVEPVTTTPVTQGTKPPETSAQTPAQGAQPVVKPTTETATAPAVTVKTFTEEEVRQRIETLRGGHKGTVDKMRQEISDLNRKIMEAQDNSKNLEYENWLRAMRESGGGDNLNLAQKAAELDRKTRQERMEFETEKSKVLALKKELDEAGRNKYILDTIKKYELPDDQFDVLASLDDRWEIAAKAAELALEKAKTSAVPSVKTDKSEVKPVPRDLSKMPSSSRLGMLMEESLKK